MSSLLIGSLSPRPDSTVLMLLIDLADSVQRTAHGLDRAAVASGSSETAHALDRVASVHRTVASGSSETASALDRAADPGRSAR